MIAPQTEDRSRYLEGLWVLIPAYQPDQHLVSLVAALRRSLPRAGILVVDDGSGADYRDIFLAVAAQGASVLHHDANQGKAAALRTGMEWLALMAPSGVVVCADSDGQHTPPDIAAVACAVTEAPEEASIPARLVLGVRDFVGQVPLRSRVGNRVSSALVTAASGRRLSDTQTGLRGFHASLIPWLLSVPGQRFGYELRVLLAAPRDGVAIHEVPIETVYLDQNASSHFRPLVDSLQVMAPLLLFALSSLIAAAVDILGVLILNAITGTLGFAVLGARLASATVNFALNRRAVFDSRGSLPRQAARYLALAAVLLVASYLGIRLLVAAGLPLLVAKVTTDVALWCASYLVQRRFIFQPAEAVPEHDQPAPAIAPGHSR